MTPDPKAEFLAEAQTEPQDLKVIDLLGRWG